MGEEYSTVVDGLKEDMEAELENLKDQFEERKRYDIEKIQSKYNWKFIYLKKWINIFISHFI